MDNQYKYFTNVIVFVFICTVFLEGIFSFSVKELFRVEACFPKKHSFRLETLNYNHQPICCHDLSLGIF